MTPDQEQVETDAYALHRAELQARAILLNLIRLRAHPLAWAVPLHPPTERRGTAVVVGAGPTLSDALPMLREHESRVTIFAVNAALPALRASGIGCDYLVTRESLDQSPHLEGGGFNAALLDVSCSPRIVETALRYTHDVRVFAPWTQLGAIPLALRQRPIYGGTAALTAACELAAQMGAERIVLVGVPLCVVDGAAYDKASAYGEVRAEIDKDATSSHSPVIRFSEAEQWTRSALEAGVRPEPQAQALDLVECYDGQRRPAIHRAQLDWLGTFARRHDMLGTYDSDERHAKKEGWWFDRSPLNDSIACEPMPYGIPTPEEWPEPADVAALLDAIRRDATYLAGDPAGFLEAEPLPSTALVETMAARAAVEAREIGDAEERVAHLYAETARQARWSLEQLEPTT